MKRIFISLVILMWAGIVNAQFTELNEARVGFDPLLPEVTVDGANYIFKVEEKYAGEFEKDPVAFLNEHCWLFRSDRATDFGSNSATLKDLTII